jgi:hypothetical protein
MKRHRRMLAASIVLGSAVGTVLLRRFPPTLYHFYPRCPVYTYLHLQCPGCGATRALAALLNGQPGTAMQLNAFFVVLLPVLLSYAGVCLYRAWMEEHFSWPSPPRMAVQGCLGAAFLFTIVRNLPI